MPKDLIYKHQGGSRQSIESGGGIVFRSGSTLTGDSGSIFTWSGTLTGLTLTNVTTTGTNTLGGTNSITGTNTVSSSGAIVIASGGDLTGNAGSIVALSGTNTFPGTCDFSGAVDFASGSDPDVESGVTFEILSGATFTAATGSTANLNGTTSIDGAASVTSGGSLTVASGATFTFSSGSKRVEQGPRISGTNYTVLSTESGAIFKSSAADIVWTLPATAEGLIYTFVNGSVSAGTGMSVSPQAADKIYGSASSGITSADNKDLINTGATDVLGDSITLLGDGADGWIIVGSTGIWAREV